jgi:hypothetical protein
VVFLELHIDILERNRERPDDILRLLTDHGYRFESSTGQRMSPAQVFGSPLAIIRCVALPALRPTAGESV